MVSDIYHQENSKADIPQILVWEEALHDTSQLAILVGSALSRDQTSRIFMPVSDINHLVVRMRQNK
jgi:hypothetical protein